MPISEALFVRIPHIVIESESLFDLLNDTAVFIRDSFQRVTVWEPESQDKRYRCVAPIRETRWWAKHAALKKIFGVVGKPEDDLCIGVHSPSHRGPGESVCKNSKKSQSIPKMAYSGTKLKLFSHLNYSRKSLN